MNAHWTSTYDSNDRARAKVMWRILILYWVAAAAGAVLLSVGEVPRHLLPWMRPFTSKVDGIHALAVGSFDPAFIEVFGGYLLVAAIALAIYSIFRIPRGSHLTFRSWSSKLLYAGLAFALVSATSLVPFMTYGDYAQLAASSRVGALVMLGTFWGFGQLFFFLCLRIAVVAPVGRSALPI